MGPISPPTGAWAGMAAAWHGMLVSDFVNYEIPSSLLCVFTLVCFVESSCTCARCVCALLPLGREPRPAWSSWPVYQRHFRAPLAVVASISNHGDQSSKDHDPTDCVLLPAQPCQSSAWQTWQTWT